LHKSIKCHCLYILAFWHIIVMYGNTVHTALHVRADRQRWQSCCTAVVHYCTVVIYIKSCSREQQLQLSSPLPVVRESRSLVKTVSPRSDVIRPWECEAVTDRHSHTLHSVRSRRVISIRSSALNTDKSKFRRILLSSIRISKRALSAKTGEFSVQCFT